ncbi:MAG: hypothetical protein JWO79_5134 [Actinomycetia bacterium]|nr:hypothetical protein [Actinomycetes bacterium]
MSVIVVMRVPGDPNTLEKHAQSNAELMQRISGDGKKAGAIHHAFAGGENEIVVIDEWPDGDSFMKFFQSQTEIPQLMQDGGATGAPEIAIYRKLDTPDQF